MISGLFLVFAVCLHDWMVRAKADAEENERSTRKHILQRVLPLR